MKRRKTFKLINEKGKVVFEADYIGSDGIYIIGEKQKHGIVNLKTGKIIKEPFADLICSDGRYKIDGKRGIVNMKTGKIIKEAFADFIYDNGEYEIGDKCGFINMKTGKITKEAK